ncbi:MAG TPA: YbaB/EbfC family nucleoid-associated protein [Jiangellales bacterium]|nr:YbaB/EbfC family nucleoid-associated protein [Jiangellales bacterium]
MIPGGTEGGFDIQGLLAQAQQMQQQLQSTQGELAGERVQGTAGGGLVTATVTGTGDLVALEISPQAVDPSDTETLADLVVAAVRDAAESAQRLAADRLGPLTQGLGGLGGPGGLGT